MKIEHIYGKPITMNGLAGVERTSVESKLNEIIDILNGCTFEKEEEWCKRCEKLNVHHLGECPFKKKEEPKPECKHNDPYRSGAGTCRECGLHYEEPKSTLREEIAKIIMQSKLSSSWEDNSADQIISLFKDTLLKEMKKYSNIGLVTNEDIEEIIKNL